MILFNAYPHFFNKRGLVKKRFEVMYKGGRFVITHNQSKGKINAIHFRKNASEYSMLLKPVVLSGVILLYCYIG